MLKIIPRPRMKKELTNTIVMWSNDSLIPSLSEILDRFLEPFHQRWLSFIEINYQPWVCPEYANFSKYVSCFTVGSLCLLCNIKMPFYADTRCSFSATKSNDVWYSSISILKPDIYDARSQFHQRHLNPADWLINRLCCLVESINYSWQLIMIKFDWHWWNRPSIFPLTYFIMRFTVSFSF